MKNLIYQFYNEGFGSMFYKKPKSFIDKHIKNKVLNIIITTLMIIIYTILILSLAGFILYRKLK